MEKVFIRQIRKLLIVPIFIFTFFETSVAQTPTIQDCFGAIPICQPIYTQSGLYPGTGNYTNEINGSGGTCLLSGESNDVWYIFTVVSTGQLSFLLQPNNILDDYDWAIYNLSFANCSDIYNNSGLQVCCNYSKIAGNTGMVNLFNASCNAGQTDSTYSPTMSVISGQTYVLNISSNSIPISGYTLDFSASTASIFDHTAPVFQSVNASALSCGSTQLTFTFSENIQCSTVSTSDFLFSGPGGPYTISNISGDGCLAGGNMENTFTITFSPPISQSGTYNIALTNASGSVTDNCGNVAPPNSSNFAVFAPGAMINPSSVTICSTTCVSLNASGGTNYLWSDGLGTNPIVTVCPSTNTTYYVTATSVNCTSTASVNVTVAPLPDVIVPANIIVCDGANIPASSFTSSMPGATFSWTNSNTSIGLPSSGTGNTPAFIATNPGTTSITANITVFSTSNNCTSFPVVYTITINPIPVITATATPATICNGTSSSLSAGSTVAGTTYLWNPGSLVGTPVSVTPVSTTTYSVTGTATGCTGTGTVTVTVNPNPVITSSAMPTTICNGDSSLLSASSSILGTSYLWNPGGLVGSPVSVTPIVSTTYTVVGTAAGCTGTATISVTVNPTPVITPIAAPATICEGASSSLSASSSVVGTTFSWNPGGLIGTPVSVSPVVTTTYTVIGNVLGCTGSATITVTVNPNPVITPTATPTTICNGESSLLTASSNVVGTTYLWNPGGLTGTPVSVTPVTTTTYTVTGTASGCTGTATITVTVNPVPIITPTAIPATICNGDTSTLSANSSIIGTTYLWNPGGLTGTPISVVPVTTTTYTVTGTASGCTGTATITVTVNPVPVITPTAIPATICNGDTSSLSSSSSIIGTTYLWNPGGLIGTPVSVNPVTTTTYTVTGTASGCTGTATITITVNPVPVITLTAAPAAICNGDTSSLSASSSIIGTTYLWNPGGLTGTPISVIPVTTTTYTVTGTASGCTGTATITVTVNPVPVITPTAIPATICNGDTSSLSASSSIIGTTYLWNPGGLTGTPVSVNPLTTTTYTVTGTASGCTGTATITVTVNPIPVITPIATPASICIGDTSSLSASSSIIGTTFLWNPGSLTGTPVSVTPVTTTTYTVTGTASGCTGTATITVTVNLIPIITPTATPAVICNGDTSSLSASSNVAGTTYLWNPGGLTGIPVSVTPASTTTYTVTGIAAGCTGTATLTVTVNPIPVITTTATPATICEGDSSSLTASSTIIGTIYLWNPGGLTGTPVTVTPGSTTTYTVTGSASGCTGTASVTVTVNPNPIITLTATPANICIGDSSLLTVSSTIAGTTYLWNPGGLSGTSISVNPGTTTTYTVTGTSPLSCTGTATITITVNPIPVITATATPATICNGDFSSLTASSTVVGTTYLWNPGGLAGTPVSVNPNSTTTYTVTGSAAGCTATATVDVSVNPIPDIIPIATPATICNGDSTSLSANSTIVGTTFLWNPGGLAGTPVSVNPSTTTTYTVIGTSPLSCTGSATVTVTVNPIPDITPSATPAAICFGDSSSLTAVSSVIGTTYQWNPGGLTGSPVTVTPISTTTYTITGTAAGCTGSDTVTITVNPIPVITSTATPSTICSGDTSSLDASSNIAGTTFVWNPGGLAGTPVSVTPGITTTYTVTGTASGCTGTATVTVDVNPTPIVLPIANPTDICVGDTSSLSASSNIVGTTYLWNPGGLAGTPISVSPATTTIYTVIGTTPLSCTSTASLTVTVNPIPVITAMATPNTICEGDSSLLTASSSVTGTTYLWNPGGLSGSPVSVNPASTTTYSVTGTAAGCTATADVTITVNPVPTVTVPPNIIVCAGDTIPATTFTSSIPGSTFAWTNSDNSIGLADSGTGNVPLFVTTNIGTTPITATITVTSSINNCTSAPVTYSITVNPIPVVTFIPDQIVCNGDTVPSTVISSLTPGTTFAWTNSDTTIGLGANGTGDIPVFTATNSGTVPIIATITVIPSANGCTGIPFTFSITVNVTSTVTVPTDITVCAGDTIPATAFTSSVPGATFDWTNSNTAIGLGASGSGDIPAFAATNTGTTPLTSVITVIATINACPGVPSTYNITVNPLPTSSFTVTTPVCGSDSSLVEYTGTGDSAATFVWDFGGGTYTPTGGLENYSVFWPATGIYNVSLIVTQIGCTSMVTTQTVAVSKISITANTINNASCFGSTDGSAIVIAANGLGNYSYQWSTSPVQNTAMATNLGAGTYFVTVTDSVNCSQTDSIVILQPPILDATAQASEQVSCHNGTDGSITVTAQGGTPPYTYALNGGAPQSSNIFTDLPPDTYSIEVSDTNGCTFLIQNILIINPDSLTATFITYSNSNCFGTGGGSVEIVAVGGTQPYSYLWSTGATTAKIDDLKNQTYYITVTDINECTGEFSIEIVKDPKVDVIIHNTFTPNGDGKNDVWFIENLDLYPDNELVVLNRWGNEVYSINGYMNDWDGDNLNEGTYFYVMKVNMCYDNTTFKGYITILK